MSVEVQNIVGILVTCLSVFGAWYFNKKALPWLQKLKNKKLELDNLRKKLESEKLNKLLNDEVKKLKDIEGR